MLGYIEGIVKYSNDKSIIVSTHGIGWEVFVTDAILLEVKNQSDISLWTSLVVRENSLSLFGFIEREELELFNLLLGVNGVGPRSALSIVSLASPHVLQQAIIENNYEYLTRVSGIGKKTAQKILLELKDKIETLGTEILSTNYSENIEVLDALLALGYSSSQARKAIDSIPKDIEGTEQKLMVALKSLG